MKRSPVARHVVEVDQSGKVEQTEGDTILAYSDGIHRSLLIPAATKRACQQELGGRGIPRKMIVLRVFVAGLLVLLEGQTAQIGSLRLDTEYEGWDGEIKGLILDRLRQAAVDLPAGSVAFAHVGKHSPAHRLAWEVHRGMRSPDRVAEQSDLLRYC